MSRLRLLYAIFFICYGLRTIYQYFYGDYRKIFESIIVRYYFLNGLPLIWDILSIVSILVMHHYTYSEKHQNDYGSVPEQKSFTEVTDLVYDNTNSSNSLIDGGVPRLQTTPQKEVNFFKSGISSDDEPIYDRKSKVVASKQSTFAFNQVDKFNTDNNTSVTQSENSMQTTLRKVLEYKMPETNRPSTTSLDDKSEHRNPNYQ